MAWKKPKPRAATSIQYIYTDFEGKTKLRAVADTHRTGKCSASSVELTQRKRSLWSESRALVIWIWKQKQELHAPMLDDESTTRPVSDDKSEKGRTSEPSFYKLQEQDVREAAEQRRASDNTTLAECLNLITPSAKQQTHHHIIGNTIRHCTMDLYNSSTRNIKQNQPSVCTTVKRREIN